MKFYLNNKKIKSKKINNIINIIIINKKLIDFTNPKFFSSDFSYDICWDIGCILTYLECKIKEKNKKKYLILREYFFHFKTFMWRKYKLKNGFFTYFIILSSILLIKNKIDFRVKDLIKKYYNLKKMTEINKIIDKQEKIFLNPDSVELPKLYLYFKKNGSKNSKSKIKVWKIFSLKRNIDEDTEELFYSYKYVNYFKNSTTEKKPRKIIVHGTQKKTALERVKHEMFKKWKDKLLKNNYALTSRASQDKLNKGINLKPMLLGNFNKYSPESKTYVSLEKNFKTIVVQPKYDGIRAFIYVKDGNINLRTRSMKKITSLKPFINKELKLLHTKFGNELGNEYWLDGELYIKNVDLSVINSIVSTKGEITPKSNNKFKLVQQMKIIIFDYIDGEKRKQKYRSRLNKIKKILKKFNVNKKDKKIISIPVLNVKNMKQLNTKLVNIVEKHKLEGLVIRYNEKYHFGSRTNASLKFKLIKMDYFIIVGIIKNSSKVKSSYSFKLLTKNGKEFLVTLSGSESYREMVYSKRSKYIYKKLKVEYFGTTINEIPRDPRCKMKKNVNSIRRMIFSKEIFKDEKMVKDYINNNAVDEIDSDEDDYEDDEDIKFESDDDDSLNLFDNNNDNAINIKVIKNDIIKTDKKVKKVKKVKKKKKPKETISSDTEDDYMSDSMNDDDYKDDNGDMFE